MTYVCEPWTFGVVQGQEKVMPVESQKAEGLYVQCVTPWGRTCGAGTLVPLGPLAQRP